MSGFISKILGLLLLSISIYRSNADDAVQGNNATLTCPFTTRTWLKGVAGDWKQLTNDEKYYIDNISNLTIRNVNVTDSGNYVCQDCCQDKVTFLNVIDIDSGKLQTRLYDKRDDFNFPIVNFPFIDSNIPAAPAYVYENKGATVVWTCPNTGTNYQWQRYISNNWKTLTSSDKYGTPNALRITIRNLDVYDSGLYQCNVNSKRSNRIILNVDVPPTVNILNQTYLAIIGGNVTLDCTVTGIPAAFDIWWTDGQGTRLNGNRYVGGSLLDASLMIKNVIASDSGSYTCHATNMAGTNNQSTQLEAGYIPQAKLAREHYVSTKGNNVTIECTVTNADAIYWYKDNIMLNVGSIQNPHLLINNVSLTDRGGYKCLVSNKFGQQSDVTSLKVVYSAVPNSNYEKKANDSVTLQCVIYDALELKWRVNGVYIKIGNSRYSGGNISVPSLTVIQLSRYDTGIYQCESLLESVSSVSADIELKIQDIPLVNTVQENVVAIIGGNTIIQCSFDSYPEPTGVSWMKDDNMFIVKDVAKYNGSTVIIPSLTIFNLDYTDSGIYVCYVENSLGKSSGKSVKLDVQENVSRYRRRKAMTVAKENEIQAESSNSVSIVGPVAGGVSGGIVAVVFIIVAVLIYTKRRKTPKKKEDRGNHKKLHHDESSYRHEAKNDGMYINIGHENVVSALEIDVDLPRTSSVLKSNDEDKNTYYNVDDVKTTVKVKDLKSYIDAKAKNDGLREEYKKIPYGILHPTSKAELKDNMPKNRFKTTFPYDHTIVTLETVNGTTNSDYINANYVDGFNKDKCYIASQGPIKQTLQDHWQMIWQNNTRKIVMLTNLVEGLKVKCERYWPIGGKPMTLDNMVLTLESEKERAAYITREISIEDKKSKEKRSVIQYHFTAWTDHGTPDPLYIVLFHKHFINDHNNMQGGPVLVHCSAGIGRTGTFIALDALLQEGRSTGNVDIVKFVKKMRYCRMNMIQTADQYVCLHHALIEAFTMEDTSISKEKFGPFWREIQSDKRPVNQQRLNEEFRKLNMKKSEHEDPEYKDATSTENIDKNRNKRVLPMDINRVFLTSFEKGRSNYVNAVQVPSYTKFVGYLTTQLPLPDTKVDFWTMIRDQNSSTIVLILNDVQEADMVYAISDDSYMCGPFRVKIKRKERTENNITEATLVMTKKDEKPREIALYQIVCKDRPTPQDLCRLEYLLSTRISMSTDPVTVVSCDGAKNCGLFCTFINAVSSMQIDAKADVFQLARLLQLRRPEFFSDYEEYRLVYEALNFYLESTNVYAN